MYLNGFRNHHISEAVEGACPTQQNSPQQCPNGLYAEQISGSAFTRPRAENLSSWVYRILPSVVYERHELSKKQRVSPFLRPLPPNPLRWMPFSHPKEKVNFLDGLFHVAGNECGHAYIYQCELSMEKQCFSNHDGEMLFVPYQGSITLKTEFGSLTIQPGMIAVIPRGVKFSVILDDKMAAGYLCENLQTPFDLPPLGIIGANGLAHPRHFEYPKASYETSDEPYKLISKFQGTYWESGIPHSPFNVVAWHGNYAPYRYDLSLFNTINTVSYDHIDPSIFTVLTSTSAVAGVANLDFVIFPPRWLVAEHTFRPPYFHRNVMSELMGLIEGEYDAKKEGFLPGGLSIHNCYTPHGPDTSSFDKASKEPLKPQKYEKTLAMMFESRQTWQVTENAMNHPNRDKDYLSC